MFRLRVADRRTGANVASSAADNRSLAYDLQYLNSTPRSFSAWLHSRKSADESVTFTPTSCNEMLASKNDSWKLITSPAADNTLAKSHAKILTAKQDLNEIKEQIAELARAV